MILSILNINELEFYFLISTLFSLKVYKVQNYDTDILKGLEDINIFKT